MDIEATHPGRVNPMSAVQNYVSLKPKRTRQFNRDQSEEDRIRRIRGISQGLILKRFYDPKVTTEEKYKLAEKIVLATIKSDKENSPGGQSDTSIYIVRTKDNKDMISIQRRDNAQVNIETVSG